MNPKYPATKNISYLRVPYDSHTKPQNNQDHTLKTNKYVLRPKKWINQEQLRG